MPPLPEAPVMALEGEMPEARIDRRMRQLMKRISTVMQRRDGNDDWLTKHWKWREFAPGYVRNFQHFNWTQGVGEASRPVPDAFNKARAEIEHLRELVERVLDPGPIGFGPMPAQASDCLLYTSPSPRDQRGSRMPSSA